MTMTMMMQPRAEIIRPRPRPVGYRGHIEGRATVARPYPRISEIDWITHTRLGRLYKLDTMLALRTTSPQLTKVRGSLRFAHRAFQARTGRCWAWTSMSRPRGARRG